MTECINELNSEDYTDFIFRDNYFLQKVLEGLEDYCISKINDKWSIISVRNNIVGPAVYGNFGYSVYPGIYGLADLGATNATGVLAVREQPVLNLTGNGTLVAIIDTGINWRHKAFITRFNTSRIRVIWDQESNIVYDNNLINNALMDSTIDIPEDEIGHGTFMAGIACGNADPANLFSGVAIEAGLIVVKVKQAKKSLRDFYSINDDVYAYSETDIMRALQFVTEFAEANRVPVSVLIGMGTSIGSHNGSSPLADMVRDEVGKIGKTVTIAAGNEGNERLHFSGKAGVFNPASAEIRVGSSIYGFTANIWSKSPTAFSFEIVSPSGQVTRRVPVSNESVKLSFIFENTVVYAYNRKFESLSGANLISLRFTKPAEGIWKINVFCDETDPKEFDFWILNRSLIGEDVYFLASSPDVTILDPANLSEAITVSAYDYRDDSIYFKNSRGYNWDGYVKPDFAAPGVNMTGPSFLDDNGYEIRSGSSVAAAFFSGIASLLLEFGIVRNAIPFIRTSEIKSIIIAGCERKAGIIYPNNVWGYGAVNIYNSLVKLRDN